MITFDLHTHSTASDGSLAPSAILALAAERGVELLSITDHDTVSAYAQINNANDHPTVTLVPGIELSAQWQGATVHIVGLDIDPAHPAMCMAVSQQQHAREKRAVEIDRRLRARGLPATLDGARQIAGDSVIGRVHFARHLVDCGVVATENTAFRKYLGRGKPGDVKQHWPSLETIVQWISRAGGFAVVAHPAKYGFTRQKRRRLIREFAAAGGTGLEIICGRQEPSLTKTLAADASDFGLLASGGSDFHHANQPWAALGQPLRLPTQCRPIWTLFERC